MGRKTALNLIFLFCRAKEEVCHLWATFHSILYLTENTNVFTGVNTRKVVLMPYMKYKNWYIPNCDIAFPTEEEAWEYLEEQ